ncbi:MAG: peptidylprolyl isomerase [bacterium]
MFAGLLNQATAENIQVLMKTSKGDIVIELDQRAAPLTVENFLAYVDSGFYEETIFHRVIPNFMIQGGGLTADMVKKPTRDPVDNEAKNGLKNVRGSISMARTSDPHSATAQFFINHRDNKNLDYPAGDGWGYTVFGKVTDGMDVVDSIAGTKTGFKSGRRNVPTETITILKITRLESTK